MKPLSHEELRAEAYRLARIARDTPEGSLERRRAQYAIADLEVRRLLDAHEAQKRARPAPSPAAPGDALPREFLLFKKGRNESSRGVAIFDAKAAATVMGSYREHGTDLCLDLEHLSLDQSSPNYSPDALAWFGLEVRNGDLYAVNVRWTPEGAARLKSKSQRYVSPAFITDADRRVVRLVNAGLTAVPATHKTPALVAA